MGKKVYYTLEKICNVGEIKRQVLEKYLFDTSVTPMLGIPTTSCKELENVKDHTNHK